MHSISCDTEHVKHVARPDIWKCALSYSMQLCDFVRLLKLVFLPSLFIPFFSFLLQGERATGYGVALLMTLFGSVTESSLFQMIAPALPPKDVLWTRHKEVLTRCMGGISVVILFVTDYCE